MEHKFRRGLFAFLLLCVAGCACWLEFGCLARVRGYETKQCNTTSSRILQSLYREDFFIGFQELQSRIYYPEDFIGNCEFNKETFAGCDVSYRRLCVIGQVWDCVQKGTDRPRAGLPNVKDNCIGSLLVGSLCVFGCIFFACMEFEALCNRYYQRMQN
jgi:hypothetical protein